MAIGPGKYHKEAEALMREIDAHTLVLIVVDGKRGGGFEVLSQRPDVGLTLPKLLRDLATGIVASGEGVTDTIKTQAGDGHVTRWDQPEEPK